MGNYFNKAGKPAMINDYIAYLMFKYGNSVTIDAVMIEDDSTEHAIENSKNLARRLFFTNPSLMSYFPILGSSSITNAMKITISMPDHLRIPFSAFSSCTGCAILGHNLEDAGATITFQLGVKAWDNTSDNSEDWGWTETILTELFADGIQESKQNAHSTAAGTQSGVVGIKPTWDGFSVFECPSSIPPSDPETVSGNYSEQTYVDNITIMVEGTDGNQLGNSIKLSSIILGHYYTFPHSPDMAIMNGWEFDGYKTTRSTGGTDFVQSTHSGKPYQFSLGVLETGWFADPMNRPQGRRTFSVNFSAIGNKDLFPAQIQDSVAWANDDGSVGLSILGSNDDGDYDDYFIDSDKTYGSMDLNFDGAFFKEGENSLGLWSDSFYKNVILYTGGGSLPFLWINNIDAKVVEQLDTNGNGELGDIKWDQFSICRLEDNAYQFTQVNFNMWNVSLELYESF